eukprot:TRINITY_DN106143_c0_g1_i1.p2 TRINITY_DN106143_c0_g1~~TRINITY_DN106143_c0_g1_i1.p2  ORF type:complete len:139 (+),score=22.12 TRINITY_DN106143_c0_g1_i1:1-417(+)
MHFAAFPTMAATTHRLARAGVAQWRLCCRTAPCQAVSERRRPFTNWYKKWVDGQNPSSPNAAAVARLLRSEGVDPYLIPRDELEDFRKQYLTQLNWFAKAEDQREKEDEAWTKLQEKKGHLVARWKGMYKLPPPANSE